jgi:uncharacterized protein YeaO (DUF488 family)
MIRTKSIYDKPETSDGRRILITRFFPRFRANLDYDLWMRELAPSKDLLLRYKKGELLWMDFGRAFRKELRSKSSSDSIHRLVQEAKKSNVTLLCYERHGEKCHRLIVQDIIAHQMAKNAEGKVE